MTHTVEPSPTDRLTFRVQSQTGKASYVVDLAANGGQGACDCPDYRMRQAGIGGRCKHIRRCRELVISALMMASVRLPQFGQQIHNFTRSEWERVMQKNGD